MQPVLLSLIVMMFCYALPALAGAGAPVGGEGEPSFFMRNLWPLLALFILFGAFMAHMEEGLHEVASFVYLMGMIAVIIYMIIN